MPYSVSDLLATRNPLAAHYSRFRVSERLLLTGHSHQAWPDVSFEGQQRFWLEAAEHADAVWEQAMRTADEVREGYRRLLDDSEGAYSLGPATHDLLVKFLSALPLERGAKIVTTDEEFYSLERQLERLEEEGIQVVRVAAHPAEGVGERLAREVDEKTVLAATSTVFFLSAALAGDLAAVAEACGRLDIPLLLDVYHQLNVVPLSLADSGLEDAYVVAAGYKYCQLGGGVAFLRYPPDSELRPIATGWFAEFGGLGEERAVDRVGYNPEDRFAGATYDPTSHYRAAAVFAFFEEQGLTPELLREVSRGQMNRLIAAFEAQDLDPATIDYDRDLPPERRAGFLALECERAGEVQAALAERGVLTDSRGSVLRVGPAPYLSLAQLDEAMEILGEVVRGMDG